MTRGSVLSQKIVAFLALAILSGLAASAGAEDRSSRARAAVQLALPLLQSSADTWFERRGCPSCHHQGLGMMAVSLARERGFSIEEDRLANQFETPIGMMPPVFFERLIQGEASLNEAIGQSYVWLGIAAAGPPAGPDYSVVTHMLAGKQHVSGKWSSNSHRPPLEDSEMTATAVTLRWLRLFPPAGREDEMSTRVERARDWLLSAPAVSTEERSMQILGLVWAGVGSEQLRAMTQALLSKQRSDGGWAQIANRESDAYATGQALVALHLAGGATPRSRERGIDFLLDTQWQDGSWLVTTRRRADPGLPYFESGFPHGKHQFISYAGSAWATMALTLGDGDGPHAAISRSEPHRLQPSPAGEGGSADLPPLLHTALYDSVDALREALAAGADPNAATAGGLTALHCAAHDPAKVAVLLGAGARSDVATASGHTPLVVAAGYDGALESVRLLLAAGADVNASTSRGVVAPGTSLLRAVMRGDLEMAALLLERGASVAGSERQLSPLHAATWQDDEQTAEFLLDRGAAVDERLSEDDTIGKTPLMFAAADSLLAVARLLIERGADVNARDHEGLTPLMFAAGASDRGTTEMVDLLLAAGADPKATNESGGSALALAREHGAGILAAELEKAVRSKD